MKIRDITYEKMVCKYDKDGLLHSYIGPAVRGDIGPAVRGDPFQEWREWWIHGNRVQRRLFIKLRDEYFESLKHKYIALRTMLPANLTILVIAYTIES